MVIGIEIFGYCVKSPCRSDVIEASEYSSARQEARSFLGKLITAISSTTICNKNGSSPNNIDEYVDCKLISSQRLA